ncbi:hypothetical protein B0T24DRAFT_232051 [Lasiosphaeria ovina]|uniref:Uncharacterized protein n=1 Tax=Lasiosphaeria ovina TaxID=92902 RepID=A0AAE0KJ94_9PEZI|nr:hypothetical protein B0T24DRAFT_232051 [Lasiosphaeria ovina]
MFNAPPYLQAQELFWVILRAVLGSLISKSVAQCKAANHLRISVVQNETLGCLLEARGLRPHFYLLDSAQTLQSACQSGQAPRHPLSCRQPSLRTCVSSRSCLLAWGPSKPKRNRLARRRRHKLVPSLPAPASEPAAGNTTARDRLHPSSLASRHPRAHSLVHVSSPRLAMQ